MAYCMKEQDALDALRVVAKFISKNRKLKVIYHNKKTAYAKVEKGEIYIPRFGYITQEALMKLRTLVYHEGGGHIAYTRLSKPIKNKALHTIWNGLEDCRIEEKLRKKYEGCKVVFDWADKFYNQQVGNQISVEHVNAPLWEAICAMMYRYKGLYPAWTLTEKAQKYFDVAYPMFRKVAEARSADDAVVIAKEIYEALKELNKDIEEEKQMDMGSSMAGSDGEESEDDSEEGEGTKSKKRERSESEDEEEEGEASAAADMDDDDEEGEGESGDDEEGEGETGDDEEGESEGKGEGETGDDEEGESEGKSEGEDEDEGDDTEGEADKPDGKRRKDGTDDNHIAKQMDEEADGEELSEILRKSLEEDLKDIPNEDWEYTAKRDHDVYEVPEVTVREKAEFAEKRNQMSPSIIGLSRALEQALRALSRCKKLPNMERGRIDFTKLTHIAKSLTKNIFYQTRKGITLDTAVTVLVDESGSMGHCYENVQLLLIALCETLNAVGIPFEVIGHSTRQSVGGYSWYHCARHGRDGFTRTIPMLYKIYKTFSDVWTNVRERVTQTRAIDQNVDGEALEYCVQRILAQRKEPRKVAFVLSDGEPCAGQGNDRDMCKNLRRVCERSRKMGVEVYAFGLGTKGPEKYYGKENFIYLENLNNMSGQFFREFTEMLTQGRVRALR